MLFDDIKTYIATQISADTDISNTVEIVKTYPYGKTPKPPQILLQLADNTENVRGTTFEGEKVSTVLLQVIVMANSMKFGNTKYNAQTSCDILCDKVVSWFDKESIISGVTSIINSRRVQWLPAQPYETGTTSYYGILRFELTVNK